MNIGIFDSGLCGLSVYTEVRKLLPHEDLTYFADQARVPYGTRPKPEIQRFSSEISDFLVKQGSTTAIMIACNTISATSYDLLANAHPTIKFFEPLNFSIKQAAAASKKAIGVIATQGTVDSGVFERGIKAINPTIPVHQVACPKFVTLVEEGKTSGPGVLAAAKEYLEPISEHIDTLILGCTHFPFLADVIKEVLGNTITLVNPAQSMAQSVKEHLQNLGQLKQDGIGKDILYTSGDTKRFKELSYMFIQKEGDVRKA